MLRLIVTEDRTGKKCFNAFFSGDGDEWQMSALGCNMFDLGRGVSDPSHIYSG